MSSLFLMITITDRRSTDGFLQLYKSHGVTVSMRTVGSGTAVQETLSTLGQKAGRRSRRICAAKCRSMCRAPALRSLCR